jgi:hypothetical protein
MKKVTCFAAIHSILDTKIYSTISYYASLIFMKTFFPIRLLIVLYIITLLLFNRHYWRSQSHMLVLTDKGDVWTWGSGDYGQLVRVRETVNEGV